MNDLIIYTTDDGQSRIQLRASDGKNYRVAHYNLDAILAIGYRVRSSRGVEFRRWANTVLKEYSAVFCYRPKSTHLCSYWQNRSRAGC